MTEDNNKDKIIENLNKEIDILHLCGFKTPTCQQKKKSKGIKIWL